MKTKLLILCALSVLLGLCAFHGQWLALGSTVAGCVVGFIIGKP